MAVFKNKRAVGVFSTRREAELALEELRDSGFAMDGVSVIAQNADRESDIANVEVEDRVGNKADDGATKGAVTGGVLGGFTGLLVGLGVLAIPGIGPIMLAGAEATALATTLAGGAIGAAAGGLVGALVGLGIPEERAKVYNDRVAQGSYLIMVDGTEADIDRAQSILHNHRIEEYGVYDVPVKEASTDTKLAPAASNNVSTDSYVVEDNLQATERVDPILDKEPEVIIVDRRDEASHH
jgi:hypothetical protein